MRRESTLHIRKRVPRRYAAVDDRESVWISLHTDSEQVAARKAPEIWARMIDAWEAKLAGSDADANEQLAAAKSLAAARGYRYLQADDVARLPLEELLARIEAVMARNGKGKVDMQEADLPLVFHPATTGARWSFTPIGVG